MAPTAPIIHATAFAVACEAAPAAFTVVVAAACAAEIVEGDAAIVEGAAELIADEPELEDEPGIDSTLSGKPSRTDRKKRRGKRRYLPLVVPLAFTFSALGTSCVLTPVLFMQSAAYCAEVRGVAVNVMSAH